MCGRQNIPLRGHREDSKHLEDKTNNPGNFQTLLNFRIESGDEILKGHFETASKNATYSSKTIQNELIFCFGKYIRETIVEEIKQAKFFSLIADEASDSSQKEQMSLVLRFIDGNGEIREEFIQFLHCESTTSDKLTNIIKKAVKDLTLDLNDARGQA